MKDSVKTLILEFVAGNGASHIQEIHLKVAEFRPEVPQHTVRARLSELSNNDNLEEKLSAFGSGFYGLYHKNENLCSVVSYPDRGPWGDSKYRGNCSGHLVKDLILRFKCQSVFDPAEGSGTVKDVVSGINRFKGQTIQYEGRDLKSGWDIVSDELPEKQFDLVFYHPPYHDIIRYSDDPKDLSNCKSLDEFERRLNRSAEKLVHVLRPGGILSILIGDKRKSGNYYVLFRTLITNPRIGQLKAFIIKIQHNCLSDTKTYNSNNPFLIPIKHEYCLIFQKA
ncbi:DNA modification methylase [Thermodesulfobacteriota bacterium]